MLPVLVKLIAVLTLRTSLVVVVKAQVPDLLKVLAAWHHVWELGGEDWIQEGHPPVLDGSGAKVLDLVARISGDGRDGPVELDAGCVAQTFPAVEVPWLLLAEIQTAMAAAVGSPLALQRVDEEFMEAPRLDGLYRAVLVAGLADVLDERRIVAAFAEAEDDPSDGRVTGIIGANPFLSRPR